MSHRVDCTLRIMLDGPAARVLQVIRDQHKAPTEDVLHGMFLMGFHYWCALHGLGDAAEQLRRQIEDMSAAHGVRVEYHLTQDHGVVMTSEPLRNDDDRR